MSKTSRKRRNDIDFTEMEPTSPDDDRETSEYHLGVKAYKSGLNIEAVPFRHGFTLSDRRRRWYVGWLDQRTRESLEELFNSHGITSFP